MIAAITEFVGNHSSRRLMKKNPLLLLKYLVVFSMLSAIMMSVRTTPSLAYENNWSVKDLFSKKGLCGGVMSTVKMKVSLEKLCIIEICLQSVLATLGMLRNNKYSWLMMAPWTITYIYFSVMSAKYWMDMFYRYNDLNDDFSNTRLSIEGIIVFGSYYVLLNSVFIYKMCNLNYAKFVQCQIEDEIQKFEEQLNQLDGKNSLQ